MFYVSSISGDQSVFDPITFNELRKARRAQIIAEETSLIRQNEALTEQTVENILAERSTETSLATGTASQSSDINPEAAAIKQHSAVALAGASVLPPKSTTTKANHNISGAPLANESDFHAQVEKTLPVRNTTESNDQTTEQREHITHAYEEVAHEVQVRKKAFTVEQIMSSPVISLKATDTIEIAKELFHRKRFRHVPIVSNKGQLVGILSDRDLFRELRNSLRDGITPKEHKEKQISEIMATNIVTSRPYADIRSAAKVMFEARIGAMPIVDDNGNLTGMFTRSDILRTVVNRAPLELWT